MNIPPDLQRYIKCPITLNPDRREAELAAIHALPQAIPFLQPDGDTTRGRVCICIPSWQEVPYPMEHDLIKQAVEVIHAHRLRLIWGRNVFPTWQGLIVRGRSTADDISNPSVWAVAINQVTQEAHLYGAVASMLDCEPKGDYPGKQTWKLGLDAIQREWIIAAIMSAREQLGRGVDFCHPAGGSHRHTHPGWATCFVADKPWTHQTYRLRHSDEFNPQPPEGFKPVMRYWSSWIHPDPQSVDGNKKPLSIKEFRGMRWDDIRVDWTDLRGVVVYAGSHLAWALAELGKGE